MTGPRRFSRKRFGIFHGITAVAELKAGYLRVNAADAPDFPRHHRRGRIEGRYFLAMGELLENIFHGITAVAELKGYGREKSDPAQ